jgi:hypothetical protein
LGGSMILILIIKTIYSFEVRKQRTYCVSAQNRIHEELSQRWLIDKKIFQRTKGIIKGKLRWEQIERMFP